MKIRNKRVLKNGAVAGYVYYSKDKKWKWRIVGHVQKRGGDFFNLVRNMDIIFYYEDEDEDEIERWETDYHNLDAFVNTNNENNHNINKLLFFKEGEIYERHGNSVITLNRGNKQPIATNLEELKDWLKSKDGYDYMTNNKGKPKKKIILDLIPRV